MIILDPSTHSTSLPVLSFEGNNGYYVQNDVLVLVDYNRLVMSLAAFLAPVVGIGG